MVQSKDIIVYRLGASCDLDEVEQGKIYIGRVQGFANFGTFVQLNDRIKGLVHKSNIKTQHRERESILVRVAKIRSNGNIDLEEIVAKDYQTETVERTCPSVRLAELGNKVGKTVLIEGEVAQIKQTGGPTIFTIVDESGIENAAAFVEAGVRAYPEVELGDIVRIIGEVNIRNNQVQIEVESLTILTGTEADPQGYARTAETLAGAGASVFLSNAAAARHAVAQLEGSAS